MTIEPEPRSIIMPRLHRTAGIRLAAALAVTAVFMVPDQAFARQSAAPASATLYTHLGGYDFLAKFVDTVFPRVAAHPELERLFRGHSRDSQMRQRQLIVDALCQYTGGPCIYIGRDLTTVHVGLGITEPEWQTFMSIITAGLTELGVRPGPRDEFVRLFEEGLKPTVVEK